MRRPVRLASTWFAISGTIALSTLAGSSATSGGTRVHAQNRGADREAELAAEQRFDEIRQEFESAGAPEERAATLVKFERALCEKTIRYLRALYKSDKNPGIHMGVTDILGKFGTRSAVEAIVTDGVDAMASDAYALETVPRALGGGTLAPEAEAWFLKRGITVRGLRKYPEVWQKVLRAVARFRDEDRFGVIATELMRAGTPAEVQVFLLESLEDVKNSKIAAIARRLAKSSNGRVQAAALFNLFVQEGARAKTEFVRALKSRAWEPRVIALRALGKVGDKKAIDYAKTALADPQVQVQIAAVRVLMEIGGKEAIEPLIAKLSSGEGRIQDDISDALARLTGRNLGAYAVQWESWWAVSKNQPGEYKAMSVEEFSALLAESADKNTLLYHGLRVVSNYVSFVMDTSESMAETYEPIEERKGTRRTEVRDERLTVKKTRMEVAQNELRTVLKNLKDGKRFDLVGFDSVIRDFIQDSLGLQPERLALMDGTTRPAAFAFVDNTKPAGQTYMMNALRTAFAYQDLDTIYLLSDGAPTPSSGSMDEILDYVRRENRLRSVRINAIGFDLDEAEKAFLRRLAGENFGVFVER